MLVLAAVAIAWHKESQVKVAASVSVTDTKPCNVWSEAKSPATVYS